VGALSVNLRELADCVGFFPFWRPRRNPVAVVVLSDRWTRAACSCDLSRLVRGVGEDGGEDDGEQEETLVRVRRRARNSETIEEELLVSDEKRGECGETSNTEAETETGVESDSSEAFDTLEDEEEAEVEAVEIYDKRDDADIGTDGEWQKC
jgi:hypothetical protein